MGFPDNMTLTKVQSNWIPGL